MIETLEENQVQLQSMMVSKFIGHFFNEISGWQKTLGVVDQVITDSIAVSIFDWYRWWPKRWKDPNIYSDGDIRCLFSR